MLSEIWLYFCTPVPRWARRSGLLYQAIAMQARYRRCRAEWDAHYARCREVISSVTKGLEHGGAVVILGSGLARDIPFNVLGGHFDRIVLVDAVHLHSARRQPPSDACIEWLHVDLAGCHHPKDRAWQLPDDTRLVVSLNLLGQLGECDGYDGKMLIHHHLQLLASAPICCLISDVEWHWEHEDGNSYKDDPWHGMAWPKIKPVAEWDWVIAPKGEINSKLTQRNKVMAWVLEQGSSRDETLVWRPRHDSNV